MQSKYAKSDYKITERKRYETIAHKEEIQYYVKEIIKESQTIYQFRKEKKTNEQNEIRMNKINYEKF